MSIDQIRRDYTQRTLQRSDLLEDPIEQFQLWFNDTLEDQGDTDPTAMVLTTCADNQPTQRVVLLKGVSEQGFVFYTNYESQKGQQLARNPNCSLHFAWLQQERQITITGKAERLSTAENTHYFQSRPRASQLGAWASQQSQVIADRKSLEQRLAEVEARFAEEPVLPLPSFWGGFRVVPESIEFWQGRSGRLHDRFRYQRHSENWQLQRLQP
ncbi:pyridoxamine 5'-phosphate oxidase [Aliidiomarina iranensis]|uniref:Pyridoxine/pyridoxamine 5'-phosphate oxidase n=1 Tax=Aliidiomarina iranensis TaxID=1434071 RepID=A0A432VQG7_9GAMM|nr:pyridoxamine 5'-phosphate oxidase [Aliidiomarina iranensis]RUO18432.1 pyridoxamine 5'-phosphate oxidase [Aliidiomarina iranensis]